MDAILIATILIVGYGFLMLRSHRNAARIVRARSGDSVATFAKEFDGSPWSKTAVETAYADLVKLAQMPVRRADDLEQTLGLVSEDFEQMVESRCRELGIADVWKSPHAELFPLKTVEDYVRFLSSAMESKEQTTSRL